MNALETQVVQALLGLLMAGTTVAIGYIAPRAKRWVSTHATAKAADVATSVIDGLSAIAETVVQDFNQRVVVDAKKAGTFTPALAASVKADAVRAVLDQGSSLVGLGRSVVGNVDALVASLVEQAVANHGQIYGVASNLAPLAVTTTGSPQDAANAIAQQVQTQAPATA